MNRDRQSSRDARESGGDSYLATVSDLTSALIFVFVIVLAVFASRLSRVTEVYTSADKTRDQMLDDIAARLDSAGIRVVVDHEQGILRLAENAVTFASGSDTPVIDDMENVGRLARALASVIPCYTTDAFAAWGPNTEGDRPPYCDTLAKPAQYSCNNDEYPWLLEALLIEGHTDSVRVGRGNRFRNNLELSSMRAATVHSLLVECEPNLDDLLNVSRYAIVGTSGYGATRPVADPAQLAENRRIDLRILLEPPEELAVRVDRPSERGGRPLSGTRTVGDAIREELGEPPR